MIRAHKWDAHWICARCGANRMGTYPRQCPERIIKDVSTAIIKDVSTATESASAALCHAVLNATVLRATCEKGDIHKSFRVHLLEAQWDEIVNLAKKLKGAV